MLNANAGGGEWRRKGAIERRRDVRRREMAALELLEREIGCFGFGGEDEDTVEDVKQSVNVIIFALLCER